MKKYLGGCLLLILLAGCSIFRPGRNELAQEDHMVTVMGGDAAGLQRLTTRIVNMYSLNFYSPDTTKLWVGSLPEDMPFKLPIPKEVTLVGSINQPGILPWGERIFLDSRKPAREMVEFYQHALESQGFHQTSGGPQIFITQEQAKSSLCRSSDGLHVSLVARSVEEDLSEVIVSYYPFNTNLQPRKFSNLCRVTEKMWERVIPSRLIPELLAPQGAFILANEDKNEYNYMAVSRVDLVTDMSVPRLASHYNEQLASAGWVRETASTGELTSFSIWRVEAQETGRAWTGTLLVYMQPNLPDRRFVEVRLNVIE